MAKGWLVQGLREAKQEATKWPDLQARVKAGTGEFSLSRSAAGSENKSRVGTVRAELPTKRRA